MGPSPAAGAPNLRERRGWDSPAEQVRGIATDRRALPVAGRYTVPRYAHGHADAMQRTVATVTAFGRAVDALVAAADKVIVGHTKATESNAGDARTAPTPWRPPRQAQRDGKPVPVSAGDTDAGTDSGGGGVEAVEGEGGDSEALPAAGTCATAAKPNRTTWARTRQWKPPKPHSDDAHGDDSAGAAAAAAAATVAVARPTPVLALARFAPHPSTARTTLVLQKRHRAASAVQLSTSTCKQRTVSPETAVVGGCGGSRKAVEDERDEAVAWCGPLSTSCQRIVVAFCESHLSPLFLPRRDPPLQALPRPRQWVLLAARLGMARRQAAAMSPLAQHGRSKLILAAAEPDVLCWHPKCTVMYHNRDVMDRSTVHSLDIAGPHATGWVVSTVTQALGHWAHRCTTS